MKNLLYFDMGLLVLECCMQLVDEGSVHET